MEAITSAVSWLNGIVWGVPMLVLILGVGLFLTFGLRLLTIIKIPFGFNLLWKGRIPSARPLKADSSPMKKSSLIQRRCQTSLKSPSLVK